MESIERKLRDPDIPNLKLTQMQDIAGCRAVLGDLRSAKKLVEMREASGMKHILQKKNDYILNPKESGYRSVHLIRKYRSSTNPDHRGLKTEIQIRTQKQHAWATAVEVVDIIADEQLKFGKGPQDWTRFFALMGTVIAQEEGTPSVPGTPESEAELRDELLELSNDLDAIPLLRNYSSSFSYIAEDSEKDVHLITLIRMDQGEFVTTIRGFDTWEQGKEAYEQAEAREEDDVVQSVLVQGRSITALRSAYRNFALDTRRFCELLENFLHP